MSLNRFISPTGDTSDRDSPFSTIIDYMMSMGIMSKGITPVIQ